LSSWESNSCPARQEIHSLARTYILMTMFYKVSLLFLFWAKWIQSASSHPCWYCPVCT